MAKYTMEITHACGHTSVEHFEARPQDVDYRIKCLEEQLCPECLEKDALDHYHRVKEANEAAGFAELSGSPKQLRWAEDIRANFRRSFEEWKELEERDRYLEDEGERKLFLEKLASYCTTVESLMKRVSSASWFINASVVDWAYAFGLNFDDFETGQEKTEILSPENQRHPGTAAVALVSDWLTATYRRDDDFIATVKGLGFRWNPESQAWRRRQGAADSSLIDAATETAKALMEKGFAVEVSDVVADRVKTGA